MIEQEFHILKYAKKHVLRLSSSSSLWDAIEMMNDFSIRHIPIVQGSRLLGVINPLSLMKGLDNYTDPSTFDQSVENFISQDYIIVNDEVSVIQVIKEIGKKSHLAALVMNDASFHGIFTEMDILNNDYLWYGFQDFEITSKEEIGVFIDEFTCVPSHTSIHQALNLMCKLKSEVMGIIDEHSKILVGTLSFMDIIHYLMYHYKELGSKLEFIWSSPINAIFPQSGLYVQEPVYLGELRHNMYKNKTYLSVLLDQDSYPVKMISIHDIVKIYAEYSDFTFDYYSW